MKTGFSKAILVSICIAVAQSNVANAGGGSEGGSVAGSATSLAGIEASQLGSVVAIAGSAEASGALANAASKVIQASVSVGEKIVISAIEVTGKLVKVTYTASIKGSQLALKLGRDVIVFSATFARAAFETSLAAAGQTLNGLITVISQGVSVVVHVTAIVAGSAGIVVGHVLSLAAEPAIVLGVILNDIGRDLYNG